MITKETALKLKPFISNTENMEGLVMYIKDRLAFLHREMEITYDPSYMARLQGQAKELRRMTTIREEVTKILGENN